jgi:3-hydroxymyristoyl/3-hydroxydecanoyl-(acyl carrier protein) dehydratase
VHHEVAPADVLAVRDATSFTLRGRSADLVNVAGKRTSLAFLDQVLGALEGVEDGAFLAPDDADDARVKRLVAFAVAPSLRREALLAALREHIDPVFLPRPLHLVEALPRDPTGKLPREALLDLARRCEEAARSRVLVQPGDAVAQGHFPGNPVVPGGLILDEVVRRAEVRLALPAGAWEVRAAKFSAALRPGEPMRVDFLPRGDGELKFECVSGRQCVASGVLRCAQARASR